MISFFVSGLPKGQPRARAFSAGGKAHVFDPGTAEWWKAQVALAAEKHKPKSPLNCAVRVTLKFFFPRPKSHYVKNSDNLIIGHPTWHVSKPDSDNLAKAVLDAMTYLFYWKDDSYVSDLRIIKFYGETKIGCYVSVEELKQEEVEL